MTEFSGELILSRRCASFMVCLLLFITFSSGCELDATGTLSETQEDIAVITDTLDSTDIPKFSETRSPTLTSTAGKTQIPTNTTTPTSSPASTATLTPSPTPTQTSTAVPIPQLRVIQSSANLRRGPGTIYSSIGFVYGEEIVLVLAQNSDGSWFNVRLADGTEGWLNAIVTEFVDEAAMEGIALALAIPPSLSPIPAALLTLTMTSTKTPIPLAIETPLSSREPSSSNTPDFIGGDPFAHTTIIMGQTPSIDQLRSALYITGTPYDAYVLRCFGMEGNVVSATDPLNLILYLSGVSYDLKAYGSYYHVGGFIINRDIPPEEYDVANCPSRVRTTFSLAPQGGDQERLFQTAREVLSILQLGNLARVGDGGAGLAVNIVAVGRNP